MNYIPQNYDEWLHCITVICGIPLTTDYVARRIAALDDRTDFQTQRFVDRWGSAHHARTLGWFREAAEKLEHPSAV